MIDSIFDGTYNTSGRSRDMPVPDIVLDTNVLVAALRSRRGASFRVLSLIGTGRFTIHVSVPLVLEYESALKHLVEEVPLTVEDMDAILDYLVSVARRHRIFFLWRPFLPDPKDDMVLEVAVAGRCSYIVTHNVRHFQSVERVFGIHVITPQEFLRLLGVLP